MTAADLQSIYHVVGDVYPEERSSHFTEYAGAALSCWIRPDLIGDSLEAAVRAQISGEMWRLVKIVQHEKVTRRTYRAKAEERGFFERCLREGFAANFHRRRREIIDRGEDGSDPLSLSSAGLIGFVDALRTGGAFSLLSRADHQWANGETPDGDSFLPLWPGKDWAAKWIEYWPSYEVAEVEYSELCGSFLTQLNDAQMWAAAGLVADKLITVHAIAIRDLLLAGVA